MPESPLARMKSLDWQKAVEAANANKFVLEYRADTAWWSTCWTEEVMARNPPLRVEFEHAVVFGSLAEALSMRDGKSGWGELTHVDPIRADDVLHPTRIVYQLKATSKMRQRWEFRDTFKAILGKHRGLVTEAVRQSKKRFIESLGPSEARVIRQVLDLTPGEFWRAVRRGERYGVNGIQAFVRRLEERTKGYTLDFPEADEEIAAR